MNTTSLKKIVTAGSLCIVTLCVYVLYGNHNWFGDRHSLKMDLAGLHLNATGADILQQFAQLRLHCALQQTSLGAQACAGNIGDFHGIPARHVTFYFDEKQNLTAWKLAAPVRQHAALRTLLEQQYGRFNTEQGILRRELTGGVVLLPAQAANEGNTDVLWIRQ